MLCAGRMLKTPHSRIAEDSVERSTQSNKFLIDLNKLLFAFELCMGCVGSGGGCGSRFWRQINLCWSQEGCGRYASNHIKYEEVEKQRMFWQLPLVPARYVDR